jgi:hypothetical protein
MMDVRNAGAVPWCSLWCLLLLPLTALAQYYEPEGLEPSSDRFVSVGGVWRDFEPLPSNTAANSTAIAFKTLCPALAFHQGGVDVLFAFGTYNASGGGRTTLMFATTAQFDVPLSGSRSSALIAPVLLGGDYTKAESGAPLGEEFNVGSIGLGVGLKYRRSGPGADFTIFAGGLAQYSFAGFRPVYGFSPAALAEATILLKKVAIFDGIAIGYRFRYQQWTMSDRTFNYRTIFHGPYVGVML